MNEITFNDAEVQKLLSNMTDELKKASRKGIEKACNDLKNSAKLLSPVDDGNLRQSLKYRTSIKASHVEGIVYSDCAYASFVHFGTGVHATKPRISSKTKWGYVDKNGVYRITTGQKPQPFLQDAFDQNIQKTLNTVKGEMGKIVR